MPLEFLQFFLVFLSQALAQMKCLLVLSTGVEEIPPYLCMGCSRSWCGGVVCCCTLVNLKQWRSLCVSERVSYGLAAPGRVLVISCAFFLSPKYPFNWTLAPRKQTVLCGTVRVYSCFGRVESKVVMATGSKVSLAACVTEVMFSAPSLFLTLCFSVIWWQRWLVLLKWWILL